MSIETIDLIDLRRAAAHVRGSCLCAELAECAGDGRHSVQAWLDAHWRCLRALANVIEEQAVVRVAIGTAVDALLSEYHHVESDP